MSRPRLLDLFCGAGGAAMGYHRAGFDVVGVDINPQPHYPFEFIQGDAMQVLADMPQAVKRGTWLGHFDAIHASPPCQDHSALAKGDPTHGTGWMLDATIQHLKPGPIWVVENVVGPGVRMDGWWFVLCGSQFGLGVRRHRRFGSSLLMMPPGCRHDLQPLPVDVTGHSEQGRVYKARRAAGLPPVGIKEKREAMGIDWMNRDELSQAIPPAYTEWIGAHLLAGVENNGEACRVNSCAKCGADLDIGEGHSITTERPSRDSPGDGFHLCDTCWDEEGGDA